MPKPKSINITWEPQKGPQTAFFTCPAFELLYGGAAGGGKSEALIVQAVANCIKYPNYRAILFRRTFPEIQKSLVPRVSYFIYSAAKSRNQGLEWNFPNGSVLYLSHLQREDDKEKHKSSEYDYIGFDELTSFSQTQYEYLFTRCRGTTPVPRMVRAATNPSGAGHGWVRERFVDHTKDDDGKLKNLSPDGSPLPYDYAYGWLVNHQVYTDFSNLPDDFRFGEPAFEERSYQVWKDKNSKLTRAFIPALLWCNAKLLKADPEYVLRMRSQNEKTQQALLYGSWDVYEGQFFSTWDPDAHVVDAFPIPESWRRYVGIDYGYTAPAAALWFAVDNNGIIYAYRELYGSKMTTSEQARSIIEMTGEEKIEWYAADPSMFSKTGAGESHAQIYHREGVPILPSSNKRIPGWALIHEVLASHRIKIFRNCVNLIRTIPTLTHGTNPEDLDCFVAGTKILTDKGWKNVEDILIGEKLQTPIGFREVVVSELSGVGRIYKVDLSNGESLEGVPHHKVFVFGKGLIELQELQKDDILESYLSSKLILWRKKLSFITGLLILGIRIKSIILRMEHILQKVLHHFIGKFILIILDRFPMDFRFITRIMILMTILRTILRRLKGKLMRNIIWQNDNRIQKQKDEYIFGIIPKKVKDSYKKMRERCLKILKKESLRADIVEELLRRNVIRKNFVIRNVSMVLDWLNKFPKIAKFVKNNLDPLTNRFVPVRIIAGGFCEKENKVYALTVDEANLYYANGVLVTNTSQEDHLEDAWRYFMLTLRGAHSPSPRQDADGVPDWFRERVAKKKKIITRVRI